MHHYVCCIIQNSIVKIILYSAKLAGNVPQQHWVSLAVWSPVSNVIKCRPDDTKRWINVQLTQTLDMYTLIRLSLLMHFKSYSWKADKSCMMWLSLCCYCVVTVLLLCWVQGVHDVVVTVLSLCCHCAGYRGSMMWMSLCCYCAGYRGSSGTWTWILIKGQRESMGYYSWSAFLS